ncbi:MAG: SDR family oxidoreductase [Thermoguttaceae bacterium]|jgi:nucleoside-diphosphate-sugar epimerase|nr:SDR family oxidoreductase [Thermoguttaceae bacterium]
MPDIKLVVGCGYLGHRVARRWLEAGHTVYATTRSESRTAQFRAEGLRPLVLDVTQPATLAPLPAAHTVLYAVGFDRQGEATRWQVQVEGLRAVLDALPKSTGRIVYLSSTAVYGRADGAWVDEDSPCRPDRQSGRIVLAAEEVLRRHALSDRTVILRLAGLYGPGRLPKMADVLAGKPLVVPASAYVNLIYVDDAVSAVLAAESRATAPRTYNVADGHPVARREFYRALATRLGRPAVEFAEPTAEQAAEVRGGDKRVSNRRMREELGIALICPTYREGLDRVAIQPLR